MDKTELGQRMMSLRGNKTQVEISQKMGHERSVNLSRWESGQNEPGFLDVLEFCKAVGCSLSALAPESPDDSPGEDFESALATLRDSLKKVWPDCAGMKPNIIEVFRRHVDNFGKSIHAMRGIRATKPVEPQAAETPAEPALPTKPHEPLPIVHLVPGPAAGGNLHPVYRNLAAGAGGQLEQLPEELHIEEFAEFEDRSVFIVAGHSMEPTLNHSERVAVRRFGTPIHLGQIDGDGKRLSIKLVMGEAPQDCLAVVDLNDEGPMVKRLKYVSSGKSWALILVPDNEEFRARRVTHRDSLVIYGVVVGVAR